MVNNPLSRSRRSKRPPPSLADASHDCGTLDQAAKIGIALGDDRIIGTSRRSNRETVFDEQTIELENCAA